MARQSMIRQAVGACTWALLLGSGCQRIEPYEGIFDVPTAAAILQPEVAGPFEEPVGFVANGHGGRILPLALKQGRVLTDDRTVSFLRTNALPTGTGRLLTSVAVTTHGDAVTLWAGDTGWNTLVSVPYLLDCTLADPARECEGAVAGAPVEQRAWWEILEEPGSATLTGIEVKQGYTATETWTATYDGATWEVEGTRSGRQGSVLAGVSFVARDRAVAFTIEEGSSPPTDGDTFVLKTRSGLTEHDVGGVPVSLLGFPDQELLAMVVHDTTTDRPVVRWFDPVAGQPAGDVALPDGAEPHRLALAEDGVLLVADAMLPAVWEIEPGATVAIEHPLPWPTLDVASLDGPVRRALYVVPIDGGSLWVLDRDTDALLDANGALVGAQGITFTSTVAGIEAMQQPYLMPERTENEIRVTGRAVAVSLSTGTVVFAHEEDGCLVQDPFGPRSVASGAVGISVDYDTDAPGASLGAPVLELDGASNRHVQVNPCAGLARSEEWTARFDQNVQAWRVTGTLAGEQTALAYEEQRYLSDQGEVSFTIRAGGTPSRDGWTIRFGVEDGISAANGDFNADGIIDVPLGIGGDPVAFAYRVGLPGAIDDYAGTGWLPVDVRPFVLVPGETSDQVARVDPQRGVIDVGWE